MSSASHRFAALDMTSSARPAFLAADFISSGVGVAQCARAPPRLPVPVSALAASFSASAMAAPTSCSARQNSPYRRRARRLTGLTLTRLAREAMSDALPDRNLRQPQPLGDTRAPGA